ncbi:hypothetical protein [Candidatus Chlorohelix sp.]|uniref:hypothetical protein n=1 Tax=Candidatus Chlorohelix sp. TaxID=3139201 RepID=UPI003074248A
MELYLEIFFSRIGDDKLLYIKQLVEIQDGTSNPDKLVFDAFSRNFPDQTTSHEKLLIHSTSWRHEEPGKFILTYLVYSDELNLSSGDTQLIPLTELRIVRGSDSRTPRPTVIKESNVVSHGFRHLSFLAKNDPVIKKVLGTNKATLQAVESMSMGLSGSFN